MEGCQGRMPRRGGGGVASFGFWAENEGGARMLRKAATGGGRGVGLGVVGFWGEKWGGGRVAREGGRGGGNGVGSLEFFGIGKRIKRGRLGRFGSRGRGCRIPRRGRRGGDGAEFVGAGGA